MKFSAVRSSALGVLATLAIAAGMAVGAVGASHAEENDGVPITVQVVTPTVAPSPRTETPVVVPVDTPVSDAVFPIVLSGLEPNSYVEIFANSTPVLIASGFADSTGRFEVTVRLPANLAVGDHTITATNTLSDGTKVTTVAVAFAVSSSGKIAPHSSGGANGNATGQSRSSNNAGTSSGTTVTEETVTGADAALLLGPDPFNLGGVFYVGGLVAHASYALSVFSPAAEVSFSVRNVSSETLTASLTYTIDNAFGMTVAELKNYKLRNLEPGETREVTALVRDIGQWGFYSARMTFVPPENVEGNSLSTFSLSSGFIALAIWVLIGMLGLALLCLIYLLGYRFKGWPSPAALFSRVRQRFGANTASSEQSVGTSEEHDVEPNEPELTGAKR